MITTIQNNQLSIKVDSAGSELCSLESIVNGTQYLWSGDPAYWGKHSPLLFPVIGRSNGGLRVDGKSYDIGKHGFACDKDFSLVENSSLKLVYQLEDDSATHEVYPYSFRLRVCYTLAGDSVIVSFEVLNTDDVDMYFSIGAHPAFACPMEEGLRFEDYYLEFEQKETADKFWLDGGFIGEPVKDYLCDTDTIALSHELFDDDALMFSGLKSSHVTLKSDKSQRGVRVDFERFTHLGLWSPVGDAPFVCIEPWYGIDDSVGFDGDITQKRGILKLSPGEKFNTAYRITIF